MSRMEDQPITCKCCGLKHYERICEYCGKPFKTFWARQRFCPEPARCKDRFHHRIYAKTGYYTKYEDRKKERRKQRQTVDGIRQINRQVIAAMLAEAGGRRQ